MTELAEKFEGQFECLGENTERYLIFSVPIKKELENGKKITYKIKFIDSFSFMSSSLSGLVNSLAEGLHSNKCTDCKSCLKCIKIAVANSIFKCLKCNKNQEKHTIKT